MDRDGFTENLVNTLHDSKTKMNFWGSNFDNNFEIRNVIPAIYGKEDTSLFGVLKSRIFDLNEKDIESLSEEEIKKIKIDVTEHNSDISRYRNRVPQEIKYIRQNFSKAAVSGTRSGNGNSCLLILIYWKKYVELVPMKNLWPLALIMRKYVFFLPEDLPSNGN